MKGESSKHKMNIQAISNSFTIPKEILDEVEQESCKFSDIIFFSMYSIITEIIENTQTMIIVYLIKIGHSELYNIYSAGLLENQEIYTSPCKQGKIVRKYEIACSSLREAQDNVEKVKNLVQEEIIVQE